jgi:hypothetical protein
MHSAIVRTHVVMARTWGVAVHASLMVISSEPFQRGRRNLDLLGVEDATQVSIGHDTKGVRSKTQTQKSKGWNQDVKQKTKKAKELR